LIRSVKPFEFEAFQKLYACSLLNAFPEYEVAMSNPGAFRDSINEGVVKKSDIISMLPFQNRIVLSSIKGKYLIYNLNLSGESYCGVKKADGKWGFHGSDIESERKYNAVIHEYIYSGGDYYKFIVDDADNQITSRDWREPLERYLVQSSAGGFSLEEAYASLMVRYER
jgi:2',3'-cyclic-nucleotide 2'-phosphodiesterase (5'-nucleotidase family)